jgi:Sec-independent protein translocase protein TatA
VIDLGISKMALIGAVALIVIGPEKLPRVARTVGTLLGKAQRYVRRQERGQPLHGAGRAQEDEGNRRNRRPRRRELGPDRRQRFREISGRGDGRLVLRQLAGRRSSPSTSTRRRSGA